MNVLDPEIFSLGHLFNLTHAGSSGSAEGHLPSNALVAEDGVRYQMTPDHQRGPQRIDLMPAMSYENIQESLRSAQPQLFPLLAQSLAAHDSGDQALPECLAACDRWAAYIGWL